MYTLTIANAAGAANATQLGMRAQHPVLTTEWYDIYGHVSNMAGRFALSCPEGLPIARGTDSASVQTQIVLG